MMLRVNEITYEESSRFCRQSSMAGKKFECENYICSSQNAGEHDSFYLKSVKQLVESEGISDINYHFHVALQSARQSMAF